MNEEYIFTNDNNAKIIVPLNEPCSKEFMTRNNHEIIFRQINTFLMNTKIIQNNI